MLSSKQQKLKNENKNAKHCQELRVEDQDEEIIIRIREADSEYDYDRTKELWANHSMIQQMQGNEYWVSKQQKSGLKWGEYIQKIADRKESKFIVFEDDSLVFGFAFFIFEKHDDEENKGIKAVLKEIYLEPSHKVAALNDQMGHKLRKCVQSMGAKFVQFDLKAAANQ